MQKFKGTPAFLTASNICGEWQRSEIIFAIFAEIK